jgi:hypothetical protein
MFNEEILMGFEIAYSEGIRNENEGGLFDQSETAGKKL